MKSEVGGRILIVDDEQQIRRFLRISLASQGYGVLEAENGEQALAAVYTQAPDVVLLDLGLPDMEGHDVLRGIREQSAVPVIVVSVRDREEEKVFSLDNGANDYVTKPFGIQELLARIRSVQRQAQQARGEMASSYYVSQGLAIDLELRRVMLHQRDVHLTRKEFAVLARLCRYAGRVMTQTQLLKEVWGPTHVDDSHYLRIVVSRLRQKLGDDPQTPVLLQTEAGVGYRLLVEPAQRPATS
ncbi:two-component system, OmpR family, KDP operon response regulator KdpE [Vreelandella subterranea]|uniref:Two-component system, OmpR family, KDP operon response regulator KdpE n=1 Tax=Vreelandella subterranea TaxID=416874 RepID=A0A1H9VXB9_9GAMM|nr:response regulator transcription factor [Halomonas subterranea]SES26178.1 two-component system, OmpR family, KDP operon response regulator KdpE [Halomonas subterranea]